MDLTAPTPLPGGMSGETFWAEAAGKRVVVRVYAGRSASRGPRAPEIDAAVLAWVRGLVPVPDVLEVRSGDPDHGAPPLLVTGFLPGVLLSELLPTLDAEGLARVGEELGTLLGRLALMATPRAGLLLDPDLTLTRLPPEYADLTLLVQTYPPAWPEADLTALASLAQDAQTQADAVTRTCLVHGDLNPKNLLVDPETLHLTGVLDWEFAHSGSPYADLGNLLRHEPATLRLAVLAARGRLVPDQADDALVLARAADLAALVDLAHRAPREPDNRYAAAAEARLRAVARSGDWSSDPDEPDW